MKLSNRTYSALLIASGTLALVCQLNPASRAADEESLVEAVEVVAIPEDRSSQEDIQHREATKRKMADIEERIVDLKHELSAAKERGESERAGGLEREIDELHHVLKSLSASLMHSQTELTDDERHVLGEYEALQARARKLSDAMLQLKKEGRQEEAERVALELREFKEQHSELHERATRIQKRLKGAESDSEIREVRKMGRQREQAERLELLMVSARNLEKAGFPDLAHEIRMRAEHLKREMIQAESAHAKSEHPASETVKSEQAKSERVHAELMEQMHQMKMQLQELQEQIQALRAKVEN